ncbi:hypothetical protein LPJ61_002405 [Coemansia biformis]|uniref:Zn(2)-C6 fungal-type domain-containing protein n=1 Tax=Coemansia biformis TaxID=1286918 RepID=A0A9W8CZP4_9FUNG|nr:hypothetical protein LPJ61_002405 [Coemansia biformis]
MVAHAAPDSSASSRASSADLESKTAQDAALLSSVSPAPHGARSDRGDSASASARYLRACDNCRRRKVKCDGVRPACGHCSRVETPCHFSIKPKSRRMWKCLEAADDESLDGVPVGAVASDRGRDDNTARLLARMETMERLLMQRTGMGLPRGSVAGTADGLVAHSPGGLGAAASASMGAAGPLQSAAASRTGLAAGRPGEAGHSEAAAGGADGRREGAAWLTDAPHALPGMLGPALGTAAADGSGGGAGEGGRQVQPASTLQPNAMSPEVISELVDTLFRYSNHMSEILHEETFRRQFAVGTLSPLLLYSALASAARYSKHPAVRTDPPHNASAVYMNKAKLLAMDAMEEPSLGNAQGLLIMCTMHFILGNEVLSTFYRALALNMCIILGYNRLDSVIGAAPTSNGCMQDIIPSSSMSMDWVDRESARRLWWTIFSIENYSSVCMGLAPSIQAEHCDVKLPASTTEWLQGRARPEDDSGAATKRPRVAVSPLHQLPAYHSQLSLIFSKVAWLVTRTDASTEDAVVQFGDLNAVLQRWYEGLPRELRLSSVDTLLYGSQETSDYYQIYVLHMRFYTTVIQLNHAIPEFTEDPLVIEPGQRKCVIAASRISDLLRSSFEIPVEARDMNWYMCVFRAAHIHIYRLLSRDTESIARAKQDLAIHRRHLREGGPLWRICLKLLSRLDDMEQMVMLLPAQIPMADVVKFKNLARKGKSQLVNMQLDSLIKPALIHLEHPDSDDLPLAARYEQARGDGDEQRQPQQHVDIYRPLEASLGGTAGTGDLLNAAGGSKYNSPLSVASRSSASSQAHPFTPLGSQPLSAAHVGIPGMDVSLGQLRHQVAGIQPGVPLPTPSTTLSMGALAADQQPESNKGAVSLMPPTNIAAPMLQMPSDLPPINTNIVIDNNMAETLVNYFYMVASNSQASQPAEQGGAAAMLSSPQMAPTASHGQLPQQQSLFGGVYDFAGFHGLPDNGSRSLEF